MILFSQCSHKIIEIKEIPTKHLKREKFDKHIVVRGLLILASLKFEFGNTIKSTKSNLKEEELKAVVRRCSSK